MYKPLTYADMNSEVSNEEKLLLWYGETTEQQAEREEKGIATVEQVARIIRGDNA